MERKEYLRIWREKNKEKTREYNKKYFQENKDIIYEHRNKHYEENRDEILTKRNDKEKKTGYQHQYSSKSRECIFQM